MKLPPEIQKRLTKDILDILKKHLDLTGYRVFIFGSRTTEKGNERSDVDVGIEGKQPVPIETFLNIQDDLENLRTLYKIDFVDFKKVADEFKNIALQKIETIYPL